MIHITQIRHLCPEKKITIDRPLGHREHTFIHFIDSVEVIINDESVITEPHTCLLYRPAFPQFYRSLNPMIHDWFHFTVDDGTLFDKLLLPTNSLLCPSHCEFITPLVKEMEYEFFSSKPMSKLLISEKATELFIKLSRALGDEAPYLSSTDTEARFRDLRGEIFGDLSHPWTVPEMASRVALSPSRFYADYKSIFGNPPMTDLIRARVDAARNALSFSTEPIAEIASSLGYANVTHFNRQFKSLCGVSPSEYRKSSR